MFRRSNVVPKEFSFRYSSLVTVHVLQEQQDRREKGAKTMDVRSIVQALATTHTLVQWIHQTPVQ